MSVMIGCATFSQVLLKLTDRVSYGQLLAQVGRSSWFQRRRRMPLVADSIVGVLLGMPLSLLYSLHHSPESFGS